MDIRTKLNYIEQGIRGISRAEDVDSVTRNAALESIAAFVRGEQVAIADRVAQKTAELINPAQE